MADNSFTFWANMKEAIDVYEGNPAYQYRMYDALTEYALYGIWPEDDGTMETKSLIMFVQSMVPSIDKSSNFVKKCAESGAAGGRKQKVTDEQIEAAIIAATRKKNEACISGKALGCHESLEGDRGKSARGRLYGGQWLLCQLVCGASGGTFPAGSL